MPDYEPAPLPFTYVTDDGFHRNIDLTDDGFHRNVDLTDDGFHRNIDLLLIYIQCRRGLGLGLD